VIEEVESSQRIYSWFAGNVGQIARSVHLLTGLVEQRFEQADQRFREVDQRFREVDQRFDRVDQRLDTFEANTRAQFGIVTDGINRLDARMERLVGYIERDQLGESESARPAQPPQPAQKVRAA
jgi:DNA anti-recombination protein RmuC